MAHHTTQGEQAPTAILMSMIHVSDRPASSPVAGPDTRMTATALRPGPELRAKMVERWWAAAAALMLPPPLRGAGRGGAAAVRWWEYLQGSVISALAAYNRWEGAPGCSRVSQQAFAQNMCGGPVYRALFPGILCPKMIEYLACCAEFLPQAKNAAFGRTTCSGSTAAGEMEIHLSSRGACSLVRP